MSDGGGSSALAGALQQGKGAQGYPLLTALEKQCKSRREIEKKKKAGAGMLKATAGILF